jgi:anti-sigma28 factor (negative regulator of flagellin synthesis)
MAGWYWREEATLFMSIQIYNDGLAGAGASETSRAQELSRTTTGGAPSSGSTAGGEDQVQISSVSSSLSAQGSERAARVQELAAAYQSGQYHVNSLDLSKALVDNALKTGGVEGQE